MVSGTLCTTQLADVCGGYHVQGRRKAKNINKSAIDFTLYLLQYQYTQPPYSGHINNLVRIILNSLEAHFHQCKRIPATIVMDFLPRSRGICTYPSQCFPHVTYTETEHLFQTLVNRHWEVWSMMIVVICAAHRLVLCTSPKEPVTVPTEDLARSKAYSHKKLANHIFESIKILAWKPTTPSQN